MVNKKSISTTNRHADVNVSRMLSSLEVELLDIIIICKDAVYVQILCNNNY